MEQGESPTTSAHPLVERQSPCRATSDRKPRQKHPRGRPDHLEDPPKEDERGLLTQAEGLPPSTPATHLYTQEKRQKARFRYSMHEVQGDASTVPARSRPDCGNGGRPQLVWLPATTLNRGCD
jgi:hypothetical protein